MNGCSGTGQDPPVPAVEGSQDVARPSDAPCASSNCKSACTDYNGGIGSVCDSKSTPLCCFATSDAAQVLCVEDANRVSSVETVELMMGGGFKDCVREPLQII